MARLPPPFCHPNETTVIFMAFCTEALLIGFGQRPMARALVNWLVQSSEELRHPDAREACRFAITSINFGLQYRLIFDTPDRMFGAEKYKSQLAEMALAFLTQPCD